jgi:hypothetical protein
MTIRYEFYVDAAPGARHYFKDMREANEFAQSVADATGKEIARKDLNGGRSIFRPRLETTK